MAVQRPSETDTSNEDEPTGAASPGPPTLQLGGAPAWFDLLVVVFVAGVLSFGGIGLLLAVVGHYSAGIALPLGAVGTVAATLLARPTLAEGRRPSAAPPAVAMLVVAAGFAIWNAIEIGHDILGQRDPGIYLLAGKWIAGHGNLVVPAGADFTNKGNLFNWSSQGVYLHSHATAQLQFNHLLPALLAEAQNIGGDGLMFRTPAVLGAMGLCLIYAVGCRLVRRPWLVLAAVTAFGLSLPDLYVSRDTYSELTSQILLWGGVLLLMRAYTTRSSRVGLVAGLAIGGTLMSHVDSIAYVAALPALAAVGWIAAQTPEQRKRLLPVFAAVVAGVVPPAILGTIDVQRRAGHYYDDLSTQVHQLYLVLLASVIVSVGVVVAVAAWPALRDTMIAWRGRAATVGAWVVGIGLLLAWTLRPIGPEQTSTYNGLIAGIQAADNLVIQGNRTYGEQSLRWFQWYLGPIALALGIAGLCFLTARALRRNSSDATILLALIALISVLYLWNPHVSADQPWVMRRFVTAALPLFVLAAAVALDQVTTTVAGWQQGAAWVKRTAIAGSVGMLAFPLGTTGPVADFHVDANFLPALEGACRSLGPNAAVIFPKGDTDAAVMPQSVRDFCGLPAATLTGPVTNQQLTTVAAKFRQEGRSLWLLAATPTAITALAPGATPTLLARALNTRELEKTLERPPQHYAMSALTIYAMKVSPT